MAAQKIPLGKVKGEGVPSGGTAGQILTKKSNTDYDAEWKVPEIKSVLWNGSSGYVDNIVIPDSMKVGSFDNYSTAMLLVDVNVVYSKEFEYNDRIAYLVALRWEGSTSSSTIGRSYQARAYCHMVNKWLEMTIRHTSNDTITFEPIYDHGCEQSIKSIRGFLN